MKISLVRMRSLTADAQRQPVPGPALPGHTRLTPPLGVPTQMARLDFPDTCPASVTQSSWELLALHVDDALRRSSISNAPLRASVQQVVRELRAGGEAWDAIYTVLHGAVMPVGSREVSFVRDHEVHGSLNAALVAHMHSWADVERLAEIDSDAHTG